MFKSRVLKVDVNKIKDMIEKSSGQWYSWKCISYFLWTTKCIVRSSWRIIKNILILKLTGQASSKNDAMYSQ